LQKANQKQHADITIEEKEEIEKSRLYSRAAL